MHHLSKIMPLVAVVGCPNVGKSSLFNRIVGHRQAIVSDIEGTTRDRVIAEVSWQGNSYWLMDTAGLAVPETGEMKTSIDHQINLGLAQADLVVFMVDGQRGLTARDIKAFGKIRKTCPQLVLVINKVDRDRREFDLSDYYRLGAQEIFVISAQNGRGVADLLDGINQIVANQDQPPVEAEDILKICVFGRPNVGKSSLVNALIGDERMVVSAVAGTTRDPGEVYLEYGGRKILLYDTAGVTLKNNKLRDIAYYSSIRSVRALGMADVAIMVIDATAGLTGRDLNIISFISEAGRGMVLFVNKWDLVADAKEQDKFLDRLRLRLRHAYWLGVVFGSAKMASNLKPLLNLVLKSGENYSAWFAAKEVKKMKAEIEAANPRLNSLNINYIKQIKTRPPTFVVKVQNKKKPTLADGRMLTSTIRDYWELNGTPVKVIFR